MAHDLIFLHHGHYPQCTAKVDKHFDGYSTLQLMTRGRLELWYDRQRHALEGPVVWPAFPGPWIRFHRAPGCPSWEHRYVAFKGSAVGRWQAEGLWLSGPQVVSDPRKFAARFDQLLEQVRRADRWGARIAANLLEGLLLELADQRGAAAGGDDGEPWVQRVIEQLERCVNQAEIDYEQLAAGQSMSLSTLRRRFRQHVGVPLHTYVLQLRMGEARRMLGDTDLPIKAIADRLGYGDVFYFSRQFAQLTGVPPATYRRSRQR